VRGKVFISPVASVPHGEMIDPRVGRFSASWQDEDAEGLVEDVELDGGEAAIAWGRQRSDTVYIRLGRTEDTYVSAGSVHRDATLPVWPPSAVPPGGWWVVPDPPTLAEIQAVAAEVAGGERSTENAVRWATDRIEPTLDADGDPRIVSALLDLTDGWEIVHGEVRRSPGFRLPDDS
jgi:hypothetical protein